MTFTRARWYWECEKTMLKKNQIFQEDLDRLIHDANIPWDELRGKTIYVTGATGLIGYTLTSALLQFGLQCGGMVNVIALVRDKRKAKKKFSDQLAAGAKLTFVEGVVEAPPAISCPVDYVIHCAAPTASRYFVEHPVETIDTIYTGTKQMLELARDKCALGAVFLSSMEVYGTVETQKKLDETELGYVDLFSPRSSYPEGKRLAENLCCCYAAEYGVPVTIVRLAQTFGPGVDRDDGRVFAYMARCALEGRDIQLNTDGSKESVYLYTADAAAAILLLLVRGERGQAYNTANEDTYCSVKEMGELVAKTLGKGQLLVRVSESQEDSKRYPPNGYLRLDTSKLRALGWKASVDLEQMYSRMTKAFERGFELYAEG